MLESDIEGKVIKWAKLHDILPLKMNPDSDSGWPDRLWLFYYPCMCFIEFKKPWARTKPRQKLKQELQRAELARRGFPVKVIDNVPEGIAFLTKELLNESMGKENREPQEQIYRETIAAIAGGANSKATRGK